MDSGDDGVLLEKTSERVEEVTQFTFERSHFVKNSALFPKWVKPLGGAFYGNQLIFSTLKGSSLTCLSCKNKVEEYYEADFPCHDGRESFIFTVSLCALCAKTTFSLFGTSYITEECTQGVGLAP